MPRHAGVIWKGDKLIDGVPETLDMLRAMEEIFASSFAAAAYLKSVNFPSNKKVAGLFSPWSKHLLKLQNSSAHFK
jgi:hypothetical protein